MLPAPVTFLVQRPLTERDRRRFCVDGLLEQGFHVRVIDFGPLLLPDIPADRSHYPAIRDLSVSVVADRLGLDKAMDLLKKDGGVAVCLIAGKTFTPAAARVLRGLGRAGVPYVQLLNAEVPGAVPGSLTEGVFRRLAHLLRGRNLVKSLVARLPLGLQGIPFAAACIHGGEQSRTKGMLIGPTTRAVAAHAPDWEVIRQLADTPANPTSTAIFLDQFLPFHPDLQETGGRWPVAGPYFSALRTLFSRIEDELGLEVVVAVHPRSDYPARGGDLFGGRRLIQGNTAALVRDCRLVIAHHSTAISFAVASDKPVLLVGSRDIWAADPVIERVGRAYGKALNRPVHSLDNVEAIDLTNIFDVDREAYGAFVTDYLKAPNSPDLPLCATMADALVNLFPSVRPRQAVTSP